MTADPTIWRGRGAGINRMRMALILIALLLIGSYFAVVKSLPFRAPYEIKARFANAAAIRADSPVRIAGVNVGEVTSVRRVGDTGEVTFTVSDEGRPVHADATVSIRPRIFLEGNFFLDLRPGSPSAPELEEDGTIPVTRTSTAVQLDEILTSLQANDRAHLVELLKGYGTGLNHVPTPAEDRGQDPDVQGESGAQALNDSFEYGGNAGRDSAIVAEALQGTEPHDLSRMLAAQRVVFAALLAREQQLQDLITNFNTFSGALAAESESLGQTVHELAPTLEVAEPSLLHTNQMLPALRAFARDLRPGVAELPATIEAAFPWLRQANRLLSYDELGRIARELRLAAPPLGTFGFRGPNLFFQIEQLSRCSDEVLVPATFGPAGVITSDPFGTGSPVYKEFLYAAVATAGESQSFDGNGQFLRFQAGGGPVTVSNRNPGGGFENTRLFGHTIEAPIATQPRLGSKPPLRTDVPCHANAIPNLNGPAATPGPPSPAP